MHWAWNEFIDDVKDEVFFDKLDHLPSADRAEQVQRLRLLRTDKIEEWFRGGLRRKGGSDALRCPGDDWVLALLLERHVLNLAARHDHLALITFWQWAARDWPQIANLWDEADLGRPAGLRTIPEQEAHFGRALISRAERLQAVPALRWARNKLVRLAEDRLPGRDRIPRVRVACAWNCEMPPTFRHGVLLDLKLLGVAGGEQLCNAQVVFSSDFRAVFDQVRRLLDPAPFQRLEHDWGFLAEEVFMDTSGTMGLWLAQWLTAGPRFAEGEYWMVPPWVVITAAVKDAKAAHVGFLDKKAELLREEGVRVMVHAGDDLSAAGEDRPWTLDSDPASPHALLQVPYHGGVERLAGKLRCCLCPIDRGTFAHSLYEEPPCTERHFPADLARALFRGFSLKEDYVPPIYAFAALENAIAHLPGRGYLHLIAPAMMGKSVLVRALKEEWQGKPGMIGTALRYAVLHGSPENPWHFLQSIVTQAIRLGPEDEQDSYYKALAGFDPLKNELRSLPEVREALVGVLATVRAQCCPDRPLLLAVDGLDELTERDDAELRYRIHQLLPLPDRLPHGCYVLLTSRPELRESVREVIETRLRAEGMFHLIELDLEDTGYRAVLTEFLTRDKSLGKAAEPHVDAILEKAEHRFLWVRFLRDLFRLLDLDLSRIPQGQLALPAGDEVFPAYLKQLAQTVEGGSEQFQQWHRPLLLLLAAAYAPVTRQHLKCWLYDRCWDREADHYLNTALLELKPLLDDNTSRNAIDTEYTLGHREIAEWLRETTNQEWKGAVAAAGHERIVTGISNRRTLNFTTDATPLDFYCLMHLPSHLLVLNEPGAAWQWIIGLDKGTDTLCGVLERIGHTQIAIEISTCRISQLRLLCGKKRSHKLLHALAKAYLMRANSRGWSRDVEQAYDDASRSVTIMRRAIESAGGISQALDHHPYSIMYLAISYRLRGELRRISHLPPWQLGDFHKAIFLLKKAAAAVDVGPTVHRGGSILSELAETYQSLGLAYVSQRQMAKAIRCLTNTIRLHYQQLDLMPGESFEAAARPDQAYDLVEAIANRGMAVAIHTGFAKPKDRSRLIQAYKDLSMVIRVHHRQIRKLGGLENLDALDLRLGLALACSLTNRGLILGGLKLNTRALRDFARSLVLKGKLVKTHGGIRNILDRHWRLADSLANTYYYLGCRLHALKQHPAKVMKYARRAIFIWNRLPHQDSIKWLSDPRALSASGDIWHHIMLAEAYKLCGDACQRLGRRTYVKALAYYRKAVSQIRPIADLVLASPSVPIFRELLDLQAGNFVACAWINHALERQSESVCDYERAYEIYRQLAIPRKRSSWLSMMRVLRYMTLVHSYSEDWVRLVEVVARAARLLREMHQSLGDMVFHSSVRKEFRALDKLLKEASDHGEILEGDTEMFWEWLRNQLD